MAEQRIAQPYQASPIPIPRDRPSVFADGFDVLADTATKIAAADRQTDRQVADIDHRIALDRQQEGDAALAASQGAAFAEMQSRVTVQLAELQQRTGGVGHEAEARRIIEDGVRGFNSGFGNNDRVRQRFLPNIAHFQGQAESRETLWAMDTRQKAIGAQFDQMAQAQANAISLDGSIDSYTGAVALARTTLDASTLPPELRSTALRSTVERFTGAFVDARLARGDAAGIKSLLEAGFFNDKVKDVDVIRRQVGAAEDAAQRETELATGRARQEVQDQANLIEAKLKAGIVPTSQEIETVRAAGQAIGLKPTEIFNLQEIESRVAINRHYAGADMMTLLRDQGALNSKVVAGTATQGEQLAARQMDDLVAARQKEQAAKYKGLLGQGTPGRVAIVSDLQKLPADARYAQGEQVEPGLGLVANLPTAAGREAALAGREFRRADPKITPPKDVDTAFKAAMGRASLGWNGAALNGVREIAADLYANAAKRTGHGETFDAGLYRNTLQGALGRTRRADGVLVGGLGRWGEQSVILPATRTQDEFTGLLQRHDFGEATYGNGVAARRNDVLRRYMPVYVGELANGFTRYRFVDAGGRELTSKRGGTYFIEVRP